jgi:hypothetical protein
MNKIVAGAALVLILAGIAPAPAQAGGATSAALGLASFAVFNQLVFGLFTPRVWATPTFYGGPYYGGYYYGGGYYPPVVYAPPPAAYYPPPAYYAQPAAQVTYAAPAPPVQNEVVYPHGRYVLRGDGVTSAYQWVWIANPAAALSGAPGPPVPQPIR